MQPFQAYNGRDSQHVTIVGFVHSGGAASTEAVYVKPDGNLGSCALGWFSGIVAPPTNRELADYLQARRALEAGQ